jgi:hypothetical protein
MQQRPVSLTIIAWFLIVSAVISAFSSLSMGSNPMAAKILAQSPLPMSAHIAFALVGALLTLVCGYGILKGYDWSRWLYIGWSVLGFVFSFLTVPIISVIVIGVFFFLVIAFFLFRPAANKWFERTPTQSA